MAWRDYWELRRRRLHCQYVVNMNVPNRFIGGIHNDDFVARILTRIDLHPACNTLRLAPHSPLLGLMLLLFTVGVVTEARPVITNRNDQGDNAEKKGHGCRSHRSPSGKHICPHG